MESILSAFLLIAFNPVEPGLPKNTVSGAGRAHCERVLGSLEAENRGLSIRI